LVIHQIKQLVSKGKKFKLVVFPAGVDARVATWINVIRIVEEAYPEIGKRLWKHGQKLMTYGRSNFSSFEEVSGLTAQQINDIKSSGSSTEGFMTFERFKNSENTAENARLFLYYTIGLNNLFCLKPLYTNPKSDLDVVASDLDVVASDFEQINVY
jgi:hypothetical protein